MHVIKEDTARSLVTRLLRHLLRPARGAALILIVVFSILLLLCTYAGLLGVPLGLILVSWFFKYAYIVFDSASRGFDEPPTLDIQMVNPVNEQRPLGQVLILGAVYALATLAEMHISPSFAIGLSLICLFLLPASTAVLGVEGNVLKACHLPALLNMVAGMGPLYAGVLLTGCVYALLLAMCWHARIPMLPELALSMFAVLSLFSLLGGLVYERRDQLGMEAWQSPERTAAKEREEQSKQDAHFVAEVYGWVRAGRHADAWKALIAWLAERGEAIEDYRWLMSRVALWEDSRYVTRLAQEFLERLLVLRETGEALQVAVARLRTDRGFRPKTALTTLQLARLAAGGGGQPELARLFTADFDARFPGDPASATAQRLHVTLT